MQHVHGRTERVQRWPKVLFATSEALLRATRALPPSVLTNAPREVLRLEHLPARARAHLLHQQDAAVPPPPTPPAFVAAPTAAAAADGVWYPADKELVQATREHRLQEAPAEPAPPPRPHPPEFSLVARQLQVATAEAAAALEAGMAYQPQPPAARPVPKTGEPSKLATDTDVASHLPYAGSLQTAAQAGAERGEKGRLTVTLPRHRRAVFIAACLACLLLGIAAAVWLLGALSGLANWRGLLLRPCTPCSPTQS